MTRSPVLVAELVDPGPRSPDCGTLHVRVVMRYRAHRVIEGPFRRGDEIFVIHGCPELPRSKYGANAGTLEAFRTGDLHRLVLRPPTAEDRQSLFDPFEKTAGERYVAERTDPAAGDLKPGDKPKGSFVPVTGPTYQGVILPASFSIPHLGDRRFTPSAEDVALAEEILVGQLPTMPDFPDEEGERAQILAHLTGFLRQYAGFHDKGARAIRVSLFLDPHDDRWHDEILSVRGGGWAYFRVTVRLDEKRCVDVDVNSPK